jgi:ABC-type transporter Mla subunit MlaD
MAPHDTNPRKEVRRHAVPLIGMALVVVFAVAGFFWWVANVTEGPDETDATLTEEQPGSPSR